MTIRRKSKLVSIVICVCLLSILLSLQTQRGLGRAYADSLGSAPLSVYVAPGATSVYALDPVTGATRWSYQTKSIQGNTPTVHYGSLYIGGEGSAFYALLTTGGSLKWKTPLKGITIAQATASNGVFVFTATNYAKQNEQDYLYALSLKDGHIIWYYHLPGTPDLTASPLDVGSTLYAEANGFMFAFNATTGAVIWKQAGYITQPSIYNHTLYALSDKDESTICALNPSDGSQLWCQSIPGADFYYSPLIANGILYVGSLNSGIFYAISTTNGAVLWQFQDSNSGFYNRPAVVNGIVYFQDEASVYALNASTGAEIWQYVAPQGFIDGTPAVSTSAGMVYINGSTLSSIYNYTAALRIGDGTLAWSVNWPDTQVLSIGGPVVA